MKKTVLCLFAFVTIFALTKACYAESEKADILVELFLASGQKESFSRIKEAFARVGVKRVKAQFYPMGHAPQIVGIGREVPADVARLTLQIADRYTGGVRSILPEALLPAGFITFGSSHFAEENHVPIQQEDLEYLLDPKHSTEEFHRAYQGMVTRTERFRKR